MSTSVKDAPEAEVGNGSESRVTSPSASAPVMGMSMDRVSSTLAEIPAAAVGGVFAAYTPPRQPSTRHR